MRCMGEKWGIFTLTSCLVNQSFQRECVPPSLLCFPGLLQNPRCTMHASTLRQLYASNKVCCDVFHANHVLAPTSFCDDPCQRGSPYRSRNRLRKYVNKSCHPMFIWSELWPGQELLFSDIRVVKNFYLLFILPTYLDSYINTLFW